MAHECWTVVRADFRVTKSTGPGTNITFRSKQFEPWRRRGFSRSRYRKIWPYDSDDEEEHLRWSYDPDLLPIANNSWSQVEKGTRLRLWKPFCSCKQEKKRNI